MATVFPQLARQDRVILAKIQADASQSVGELAEQVGMSKSACWRRLQKLEEMGVIRGRVALLDANALNLSLTVYISVRTNQHNDDWAARFQQATEQIPGVLEVYRMSGDLDYLIKAVVADMPDYDRLYKAPKDVAVHREEIYERIANDQVPAQTQSPEPQAQLG